jgi:cytoskeleton protein RodZ
VSLFQRITTPFAQVADEDVAQPGRQTHTIGDILRDRREELGLDLDDAGAALRIKPIFLAALEQGRTADLPGPTYAAGFIRAYAQYLGLDDGRVLDRYKAESDDVQARPDLSLPVPLSARSVPGGPILLVALILALCGYGTWYYLSTAERSRPERVAAVPAELAQAAQAARTAGVPAAAAKTAEATHTGPAIVAGSVAGAGAQTAPVQGQAASSAPPATLTSGLASPDTGTASTAAPTAPPVTPDVPRKGEPATSSVPVVAAASPASSGDTALSAGATSGGADPHIDIRALGDCWIQVRAPDQSIVFSRVLRVGETFRVPRSGLVLRTGNAGALAITVDGKPAPAIGGIGAFRRDVVLDPQALAAGTAVHG